MSIYKKTLPSIVYCCICYFISIFTSSYVFAATLNIGSSSVVLKAGETIEMPLYSNKPIASDLTAEGLFQDGDVSFTPSPSCHLASTGCTLMITAAATSKSYTTVPVIISESNARNKPIFLLSIIPSDEPFNAHTPLPQTKPNPLLMSNESRPINPATTPTSNRIITAGGLTAVIIPHSIGSSYYTSASNGPVYQMIQITNTGVGSVTLDTPTISGTDAAKFSIDTSSADYSGTPILCSNAPTLGSGESCEIIITSTLGDPASTPATATLTISDGISADTLTFTLTDTSYVYAGGGFDTLGNANVSGGSLLAQCTAGTCTNALSGTTGNNYASTNNSVGQWINALTITPTGTLIIGGVFGEIGGATSGATSGTAALLAQCIPGTVTGNACFNQLGSLINSNAFNNAYIDTIITATISSNLVILLGGDFKNIRGLSFSGPILTKCTYPGVASNQSCSSYLLPSGTKYANQAIAALSNLGSSIQAAGLFTQIAGYPTSPPSVGTTFASCSTSSCSQGMGDSNPNSSILGMSNNGTSLYMGGTSTQIGSYVDNSGGYPLVQCTIPGSGDTTCSNALSGTNDANGYIEGLVYSREKLYVGGNFTTIGGATPVSGGNMLAVCTPGGECSNFITSVNPYATGSNWGGGIFALAVGNQTTITAN